MIKPTLQDDALLADIRSTRGRATGFRLWWLGQSGYLLQYAGRHILIDPYLSDSLTHKYASTSKPHVRMSERVIDPARLNFIDIVTTSHNHTDHLDAETLKPLFENNRNLKFVIPEANRSFIVDRCSIDAACPIGMSGWTSATIEGFEFTGVPAAHNLLDVDEQGRNKYLGYVIKFGPWTIFHAGDTLFVPGNRNRLRSYQVDVALLPINGNDVARGVAGNMNPFEAAVFAKDIGCKLAVPCHYDLFAFNTADPGDSVTQCRRVGQRHQVLSLGERFDSTAIL